MRNRASGFRETTVHRAHGSKDLCGVESQLIEGVVEGEYGHSRLLRGLCDGRRVRLPIDCREGPELDQIEFPADAVGQRLRLQICRLPRDLHRQQRPVEDQASRRCRKPSGPGGCVFPPPADREVATPTSFRSVAADSSTGTPSCSRSSRISSA